MHLMADKNPQRMKEHISQIKIQENRAPMNVHVNYVLYTFCEVRH